MSQDSSKAHAAAEPSQTSEPFLPSQGAATPDTTQARIDDAERINSHLQPASHNQNQTTPTEKPPHVIAREQLEATFTAGKAAYDSKKPSLQPQGTAPTHDADRINSHLQPAAEQPPKSVREQFRAAYDAAEALYARNKPPQGTALTHDADRINSHLQPAGQQRRNSVGELYDAAFTAGVASYDPNERNWGIVGAPADVAQQVIDEIFGVNRDDSDTDTDVEPAAASTNNISTKQDPIPNSDSDKET
ncbi:hypothetical protein PRK78_005417 [Emydomyces testavorans]|uniref:Uncharacterized protein n=1 Tax=Emydomyces testavorans TaxID=2070801 RepID=A0AAF0IJH7_9EURO|nr:hypothetical protein PRK78_005417 [Emydomyces testavorans]